jgi:hypothetical protein
MTTNTFNPYSNTRHRDRQSKQFVQACNTGLGKPKAVTGRVTSSKSNAVEVNKPKFEYLIKHKGVKVILTDHCRTRAAQRHGMPIETMKDFFIRVIDGIWCQGFKFKEYNQEVFVYSAHYQRGAIVAYRRDFKNQASREMCLAVVTIYPYGKSTPAHKDTEVIYV